MQNLEKDILKGEEAEEAVELTYAQLLYRLKHIQLVDGNWQVMVNTTKSYLPKKIIKGSICKFNINGNKIKAFTLPRPNQIGKKYKVKDAIRDIEKLKAKGQNELAFIVDQKACVFSVCGVCIDKLKETITLMNGYYKGNVIDWEKQGYNLH